MARRTGDGFERMKEMTSGSDSDGLGDYEKTGKKYKYRVSSSSNEALCSGAKEKISRRDVICLIIGGVIVGVIAVAFIILAVVLQSRDNGSTPNSLDNQVRLPSSLEPILYRIDLEPDLDTLRVTGSVDIDIRVVTSTDLIVLHSKDMTVSGGEVTVNDESREIGQMYFVPEHDFLVLKIDSISPDDSVTLTLNFNYTLRDDLVGFYLSSYRSTDGSTVRLASTQFEPTDARRAFPCFDEPAKKANFSISIKHSQGTSAVSNMPTKSTIQSRQGASVTTAFQTSYKMSTYLVAFIVSDFDCSDEATVNDHIQVRVCASPVVFNSTSYAQEVAVDVIGYYEQFFGVEYPLPKQDLFAIPDFSAGAMENWGLITYRETALLYDPTQNPYSSKQRVAVVIAHELAHQWFGNLVTMEWWDGLWLNEGFASYVEYIGTDHKEPSWKMLEQFYVDTIQYAYHADGLNWSHPILQTVSDPDEINGLFDSISYDKGASLIRMLLNFIGESDFTKGLANYLNSHKFGNARTEELWDALNKVATSLPEGITVTKMMDTWTMQMGYPVVTLTRDGNRLSYRQERYLSNPLPTGGQMALSPFDYKWMIPFSCIVSSKWNKSHETIIQDRQGSIDVDMSANEDFVKGNYKQNGFYRVNYDMENWQKLIHHLNSPAYSQKLSGVDRAGVIDDAFALSSAGLLNVTVSLDLSLYLRREREYVPWAAASSWFNTLSQRLSLTPIYGKFQKYLAYLLNNTVIEYSYESTHLDHLETFLRTLVLRSAWGVGDNDVAMAATELFSSWMEDPNKPIQPNLRLVVYPAGIALGGETEWEFLWQRYLNTNDPYEKSLYLYSLSYSKEPWILNRYLQYSLTKVRSQDTLTVIRGVSRNVNGRYLAWNFFRDNYDTIFTKYGGGSFSFSRLILSLTQSFTTEWELQEFESFFSDRNAGSGALAVHQARETILGNILYNKENLDVIDSWIDNNVPPNQ